MNYCKSTWARITHYRKCSCKRCQDIADELEKNAESEKKLNEMLESASEKLDATKKTQQKPEGS